MVGSKVKKAHALMAIEQDRYEREAMK